MSRVDDDRQAQRAAEKLALQRQQEKARAEKQQGETAFSRRLAQPPAKEGAPREQQPEGRSLAQSVLERARAQSGQGASPQARAARSEASPFGERMQAEQQSRLTQADARGSAQSTQGRKEDARVDRERLSERGEESLAKGDAQKAGALSRGGRGGELRTDGDRGGGGGGQDKGGEGGRDRGEGGALSFRFNPALMAPVPVARPRETPTSDRLRAIAAEIAQKIVERVRVGTNAAGAAEFQIDLRSNVLSGLAIKVSCKNGRIQASFSGSDKEVLKLLREQSEALKTALSGRGLTLEELRVEERA
jgi:hypothetical protein